MIHASSKPGFPEDVPVHYRKARPEGLEIPEDPCSMFLWGPNGTGKTWTAAAAIWKWSPRFCSKRYVEDFDISFRSVPGMLSRLHGAMNADGESPDKIVSAWKKVGLLVMDDLGAEKATDWSQSLLREILDARLGWERPTIVTSNLSLPQINEFDPRLASRLAGMKVLKLDGQDRRVATA